MKDKKLKPFGRIMHLYGAGKHRDEIIEKKARAEVKKGSKAARLEAKKPPKFASGMQIGVCILLKRYYEKGYFGAFHNGRWQVKCQCGITFIVPYWKLYQGKLWSCGCVKRTRKKGGGRPTLRMSGARIGRLTVGEFVSGEGWVCRCEECGEQETVRYSGELVRAGMRACSRENCSRAKGKPPATSGA